MKAWILRWLGTPKPLENADLFQRLQKAQSEHISDLRVLIDKGHEREAMLASIVQQSVSQAKARPVDPAKRTENNVTSAIPIEHLSDVQVFPEDADQSQMSAQERELAELIAEQETQGITKP